MNKRKLRRIYLSLVILSITVLFFSCREKNNFSKGKNLEKDSLPASTRPFVRPPSGSLDTLIIDRPSAVLFTLDSLGWENSKINMGYREHETAAHECLSLLRNTRSSLTQYWKQIRIYEVTTTRYLLFIGPGEKKTFIDLDSMSYICGTYLFSVKKPPMLSDMMNIGNDLDYYFKK